MRQTALERIVITRGEGSPRRRPTARLGLLRFLATVAIAVAAVTSPALAGWTPLDGLPGAGLTAAVGADVWAVEVYDDGTGAALYAAGGMAVMGTTQGLGIFRWDGQEWTSIGEIAESQTVYCMGVWDGKLVVAGTFTEIDGAPINRIATWDGTSWAPLGAGIGVSASYVWEVGTYNGDLIATGSFSQAGGAAASSIARWDGAAWSPLGAGIAGIGRALTVFEGDLVVGGSFTTAGGVPALNIARWDGVAWSAVSPGNLTSSVFALEVFDTDGAGPNPARLLAAGTLCSACNSHLVQWDGAGWSAVAGTFGPGAPVVYALDIRGADLVVAGVFRSVGSGVTAHGIALWNPATGWSPAGTGLNPLASTGPDVRDVAILGTELVCAGNFWNNGSVAMKGIARWTGGVWEAFTSGLGGVGDPQVNTLVPFGAGVAVGGSFTSVGDGVNANNVALYTPSGWEALGSGIGGEANENATVNGLILHAGELHAAYQYIDGSGWRTGVSRWDGSSWQNLMTLTTFNTNVLALVSHGGELYAGGVFTTIGATPANRIARFDGTAWQPLGAGTNNVVNVVLSYGTDLIAGGTFTTAGGVPASRVARWDGTQWFALGAGLPSSVVSLCEHGGELYAGCQGGVYRWDGVNWNLVGSAAIGTSYAKALLSVGGDLYAGGSFSQLGPPGTQYIARWDGTQWNELDGGLSLHSSAANVRALTARDGSVWVGSNLYRAGNVTSAHLARWTSDATSAPLLPGVEFVNAGGGVIADFRAPFAAGAGISFRITLGAPAALRLTLFDAAGRRVAGPLERLGDPGTYEWSLPAAVTARMGSGVYFARLEAGDDSSPRSGGSRVARVVFVR